MSDLWPRIEPLLARVEKPARYIGMERGSQRPHHEGRRVAFLLIYPDTYEIGLPNQGLPDPLRDPERARRAGPVASNTQSSVTSATPASRSCAPGIELID